MLEKREFSYCSKNKVGKRKNQKERGQCEVLRVTEQINNVENNVIKLVKNTVSIVNGGEEEEMNSVNKVNLVEMNYESNQRLTERKELEIPWTEHRERTKLGRRHCTAMEIRCGRRLRDENPYWIPKTETSKVCRKDEDGKRRQERKQTGVLRVDNEAKHGGRLPELASFYENMRKLEV